MFRAEEIADEVVIEVAAVVKKIRGDAELAKQMRNSCQSLSSNLGEGAGRSGKERRKFYSYAYGSGRELRRQLKFAVAFEHVSSEAIEKVQSRLDSLLAILWCVSNPR